IRIRARDDKRKEIEMEADRPRVARRDPESDLGMEHRFVQAIIREQYLRKSKANVERFRKDAERFLRAGDRFFELAQLHQNVRERQPIAGLCRIRERAMPRKLRRSLQLLEAEGRLPLHAGTPLPRQSSC